MLFSLIIEIIGDITLIVLALIYNWHAKACEDPKGNFKEYMSKVICTQWYRYFQFSIETITIGLKIYFVCITK